MEHLVIQHPLKWEHTTHKFMWQICLCGCTRPCWRRNSIWWRFLSFAKQVWHFYFISIVLFSLALSYPLPCLCSSSTLQFHFTHSPSFRALLTLLPPLSLPPLFPFNKMCYTILSWQTNDKRIFVVGDTAVMSDSILGNITEGICPPLRFRIEKILCVPTQVSVLYSLLNLLRYYRRCICKVRHSIFTFLLFR